MSDREENKEIIERLSKIQQDIDDIKSSIRLLFGLSNSEIKRRLQRTLDSDGKRIAYELTDGINSSHDIARKTGTSMSTINRWWREWERNGLVRESVEDGRIKRKKIFSLKDLGIDMPDISSFSRKSTLTDYALGREQLRSALRDSEIFHDSSQLARLAERVFGGNYLFANKEDLIEKVIEIFFDSPKRNQLIFIQALKDEARTRSSPFVEYFEKWERNIKGEDRINSR